MEQSRPRVALSIAGSDPSGGAGLQADLRTFAALDVHGAAAVTALTVQSSLGVSAVHPVEPGLVAAQIDAVLADLPVDALKIGMLASEAIVLAVAGSLRASAARPLVLDPVVAASDGTVLLDADGVDALRETLVPMADVLTPNLAEAAALLETSVGEVLAAPEKACRDLRDLGPRAVLLKGGHAGGTHSEDLFWDGAKLTRLTARRIVSRNTHGTGCVLSSAIAAHLARGLPRVDAVRAAKALVTAALEGAVDWKLGAGSGPLRLAAR